MKSQIYLLIIFFWASSTFAQPKLSLDIGLGFYQPTLTGFDENIDISFPEKNFLNRNILSNWGLYYEFFYNARIGYTSFSSYEVKNNVPFELVDTTSSANFRRTFSYRFFPLETFFRWKPRIELNFTLTPIWGKGSMSLETKSGDQLKDWEYFIESFGGNSSVNKLETTETMTINWFGYGSMIGVRYYITSRIGLDIKSGFMNHFYDEKNWKLKGRKVTGPKIKIDDLPIFSIKITYGVR